MTAPAPGSGPGSQATFVPRVAGVLATRVSQFGLGLVLTYLLAHQLGPAGRGVSYLVLLIPSTLIALGTFGFPSSITFYAGRGRSVPSLRRAALILSAAASAWLIPIPLILLPFLKTNVLDEVPPELVYLVLLAVPFQISASLMGSILYGRQVIRNYNVIQLVQSLATLILVLTLTGIVGLSVTGAVASVVAVNIGVGVAVFLELRRAERLLIDPLAEPVRLREIVSYGLQLYPGIITNYFNYRADVFLLNWLLAPTFALAKAAQIGLYSVAVSLAEMTFYLPDSISTILFPRVSAGTRQNADQTVPTIARLTIAITTLGAIALVPAAYVGLRLFLPEYLGGMPALVAILPGVVALSLSKVLAGYTTGLGQARPTVVASSTAVVVNVAFNLLLIPIWGIVGAAVATLISYTASGALMVRAASRFSGAPVSAFLIPTGADIRLLIDGLRAVARQAPRRLFKPE